jgi:hypothetical protein
MLPAESTILHVRVKPRTNPPFRCGHLSGVLAQNFFQKTAGKVVVAQEILSEICPDPFAREVTAGTDDLIRP